MREIVLVSALSFTLAACGATTPELDLSSEGGAEAIVGGVSYAGLPAVGALFRNGAPFCTGTLVGPRKVLTAAHCLQGVTASQLQFRIGANAFSPAHIVSVSRIKSHPDFDMESITNDIGLVTLRTDAPATPLKLLAEMDESWVGTPMFIVGYGVTSSHSYAGAGKKRAVTIPVTDIGATKFEYQAPGKSACNGDSGGPALYHDPNGTFLVAGVTSYGDADCEAYGVDTRTDVYASFVGAPTALPSDPCRGETFKGRCAQGLLIWCDDQEVKTEDCAAEGATCGWQAGAGYYNCL